MQPHTLDPRLLSPDVSDEVRKFLLFTEVSKLSWERNVVFSMLGGEDSNQERPGPETYQRFVAAADQAQQLILMSKRLFETPERLHDFLNTFSLRQTTTGPTDSERKAYLSVASLALLHESAAYSATADWLRQWFEVDTITCDKSRLETLALQFNRVKKHFNNIQPGLYEEPKLYANSEFRNIEFHRVFFRAGVDQQLREILGEMKRSSEAASLWLGKIRGADEALTSNVTLESEIKAQLKKLPIDGMNGVRKLVFGQARPSCEECSGRLYFLLELAIHHDFNESAMKELKDNIAAISHNSDYLEHVMVEDICEFFRSEIITVSNDGQWGYSDNEQKSSQTATVLKLLDLDHGQLATIAMSAVAGYSRGKLRDFKDVPVGDQLKSVMRDVHASGQLRMKEDSLSYALLAAITKSLPGCLVEKMASVSDQAKVTCYDLTGNARYLDGITDVKLQDSVFSKDLGL